VLDVRNEVVTDEDLQIRVAEELALDPRTRSLHVRIISELGNVCLEGEAPDWETREIATEVAARVPRVRAVTNRIGVPGDEIHDAAPPSFQPRIGQPVRTLDGRFGHVARVILSLRNRYLVGIVVEGELPTPTDPDTQSPPEDWPRRHRAVMLPVEWIEAVGDEVLLRVTHWEAAMAREFQPGDYAEAGPGWEPPYPYRREDVLIDLHRPPIRSGSSGR
jgi:hypothetical protein